MKDKDPEILRYLFCIESEGKSICRIYQSENHEIELYISDLHVDEKYHKTGIGTEIMKAFENIGKELQADLYLFCIYVFLFPFFYVYASFPKSKFFGYQSSIVEHYDMIFRIITDTIDLPFLIVYSDGGDSLV